MIELEKEKEFDWSFLNGDFRIEKKSYDFSDKRAR